MKRIVISVVLFVAFLALNASFVTAEDHPRPPEDPTGGCSTSDCK